MKIGQAHPEAVWAYWAAEPGPAAAVVGGVHGNELAGIRVIERLKRQFDAGALAPVRGTVLLAVGNPRAVAAGVRAEGEDLNRCFTDAVLAGEGGAYAHLRARELAAVFGGVSLGIDIHGTNTPSRPFVVIQRGVRPGDEAVLGRLSAGLVLRDPRMVFAGEPSTLDELFARSGGLGICYETGASGDDTVAGRIVAEIVAALSAGGWLPPVDPPQYRLPKAEYVLAEKILLTEAGFRFADGVGDVNFQPLAAGSRVGCHGTTPLVAPSDCLLV
ncbi:MAG TPA: succinylglutamate desuccinylase/aspartoacylase family protein, partial [Patescibacteria group bacterium]|nr:succinylglutamate desuccinylase/aspartoacylase family protein [Patescibacteria group bacterium]